MPGESLHQKRFQQLKLAKVNNQLASKEHQMKVDLFGNFKDIDGYRQDTFESFCYLKEIVFSVENL